MRLLGLIFLLVLATACGGKSSQTNIKVTSSALFGGTATNQGYSESGLMLWGSNNNGQSFGRVLNDVDSLSLDLPNGSWTFMAIAWDNNTDTVPMKAPNGLRCGESAPVSLTGQSVNVALSLNTTDCTKPIFKGRASNISSKDLLMRGCKDTSLVNSESNQCNNDHTVGTRVSDKAPVMSIKLRLAEHDSFGGGSVSKGPGLERCIPYATSTNGEATISDLKLPGGDPLNPAKSPFRIELEMHFSTTNCTDTASKPTLILPQGLVSNVPGVKYLPYSNLDHFFVFALPDAVACNGRSTTVPFAGGDGTDGHPYLICSAVQMQRINLLSTNFTKSYRLGADINLNDTTLGLSSPSSLPAYADDCWETGNSWQPIGLIFTSNTCADALLNFTGSFYGSNHVITGMRIKQKSRDNVGFIGNWVPSAGGKIYDLKFKSIDVSGRSKVGGLLGSKINTTASYIENITIDDARIEATKDGSSNSWVGGVFGYVQDIEIQNIRVDNTRVEGEGKNIGGVAGQVSSVNHSFKKIYSSANVFGRYSAFPGYHGGVAGYFISSGNGSNVGKIRHEGFIQSQGSHVGGLFGLGHLDAVATSPLNDVYATSVIYSTYSGGADRKIGGLIGESNIQTFNRNYFAGEIYINPAGTTCNNCGILMGNNGYTPKTLSNVRALNTNNQALPYFGDDGTASGSIPNGSINNNERISSYFYISGSLSGFDTLSWIHTTGGLPRFVEENHPCAQTTNLDDLSLQSGRGSVLNPLTVCTKEQLSQVGSLGSGKYVTLLSNVNLTGTYTPVSIPAGVTLDGKSKLVFSYAKNLSGTASGHLAPFAANNGTIKNLSLANISVSVSAPSSTSSVSGALYSNNGTIDNLNILSAEIKHSASSTAYASGVAYLNYGIIKNTKSSANVGGINYVAGLVSFNYNQIMDSVVEGTLFQSTAGSSSVFGGIALQNGASASIKRSVVRSKVNTSYSVDDSSMVVRQNLGLIEDIEISREANWRINGFGGTTGIASVAVTNSGTINRVLMNGFLLDTLNNVSTIAVNNSGKPVLTNTGTVTGVSWTIPSGRLIQNLTGNGTNITCSSGLVSFATYPAAPFNNTTTYWDNTAWDNIPANGDLYSGKYVWIVAESNGFVSAARAIDSYTSTNLQLNVSPSDCSTIATNGMNVYLIQDYSTSAGAAIGSYTSAGSNYNGYIVPGSILGAGSPSFGNGVTMFPVGSPWRVSGVVLDETVTTDMDLILEYYSAVLVGQSPASPTIWTIEEGGSKMGLFSINN